MLLLVTAVFSQPSSNLRCIRSVSEDSEVQVVSCDGICVRQIILIEMEDSKGVTSTRLVAVSRDCSYSEALVGHFENCTDSKDNAKQRVEPRVITCFCDDDFCNF